MIALGLDPGTSRFGWGIVWAQDGTLRHKANVIEAPSSLPRSRRLYVIWSWLEKLEDVIGDETVDVVVVEQGFAGPRASNTGVMAIGEARALAYLIAGKLSAPVEEIAPATMKRNVTGHGNADKALVRSMVNATLGLVPPYTIISEDAADATGLALALMHERSVPELMEARFK
jgi:Holliday junction resolvasome RuvABC endonuclease subunit